MPPVLSPCVFSSVCWLAMYLPSPQKQEEDIEEGDGRFISFWEGNVSSAPETEFTVLSPGFLITVSWYVKWQ